MCGLVGALGNFTEADRKAVSYLLILDWFRGRDSTGLGVVAKDGTVGVAKEVGDPFNLFRSWDCFDDKYIPTREYKVFIGHNRAATVGAVTVDNAHPFWHGHIMGAHNGTLRSVSKLEDGDKFEVDSEAVFYTLSKRTIKDTIESLQGAYALTWYDANAEKVYIIRNNQRPLWVVRRKDRDVLFWASEEWMLRIALTKAGVSHLEPEQIPVDTLFSFDVSGELKFTDMRKRELVKEGPLKGYCLPPRQINYSSGYAYSTPVRPSVNYSSGKSNKPNRSENRRDDEFDENTFSYEQIKKLIGTEVEFYVEDKAQAAHGAYYLIARDLKHWGDYEIRIFGDNHKNFNEWASGLRTWKAKIKGVTHYRHKGKQIRYALVDLRTIVPSETSVTKEEKKGEVVNLKDHIPFEKKVTFRDWSGQEISYEEWLQLTDNGCAWCGESATPGDKLVWIGKTEHVCEHCSKDPSVVQYAQYVLG